MSKRKRPYSKEFPSSGGVFTMLRPDDALWRRISSYARARRLSVRTLLLRLARKAVDGEVEP